MIPGLLLTAGLMGLAGSAHCAAMCGAATTGIACGSTRLASFQAGRVVGYAALGAAVAASSGLLGWAAGRGAWLQPFWALFHVAVLALAISLLWRGRQPRWLDGLAQRVWREARHRTLDWQGLRMPFFAGLLWGLLPCGLLYSALMVAALAPGPADGAAVMATFAGGSALGLHAGPMWWRRFGPPGGGGAGAVRLAGAVLAASSLWALGHGVWSRLTVGIC
ncbi:MAG TPA: sulfite exporter TauE/SafE family protein [Burkholderiaceae bacterium]|nr:sulfite exporter TauE/SafE family protein [Burkholderiaceae bacterium]